MGAMKGVYEELTQGIQSYDKRCEEIGVCMSLVHDRLDGLTPLIGELATRVEDVARRLDQVQEWTRRVDLRHEQQVQKLLDRVVEMAMVNQGKPVEAAVHRTRSDNSFSNEDSWSVVSEQNPDDAWPPAGCDSMELKG